MAGDSSNDSSLPYHEPDIVTILVQTSLLLLLNVVNAALDKLLYCGLLGQVLIGIAWGTPGAKWLTTSVEDTIVQLRDLGLILLVYEGLHSHPEKASDDVIPNWTAPSEGAAAAGPSLFRLRLLHCTAALSSVLNIS